MYMQFFYMEFIYKKCKLRNLTPKTDSFSSNISDRQAGKNSLKPQALSSHAIKHEGINLLLWTAKISVTITCLLETKTDNSKHFT